MQSASSARHGVTLAATPRDAVDCLDPIRLTEQPAGVRLCG